MKRRIIFLLFISIFIVSCTQKKKEEPFVAELALPQFQLATVIDSTMVLSQDIPTEGLVIIKYFTPDCNHCQEEVTTYFSKKDSLSNIKTLWMSGDWATLEDIQLFAEVYKLKQLNPIYIGKDVGSNLVLYYDLKTVPFAVVYKDNQLIKEYRGDLDFDELIDINYGKYVPEPKDSILKKRRKFTIKR